jgi:hypothetical protein
MKLPLCIAVLTCLSTVHARPAIVGASDTAEAETPAPFAITPAPAVVSATPSPVVAPSNAPVFVWNLFLPTAEPEVDGGISGSSGSLRETSSPSPVANTQPEVPLDRPTSTSDGGISGSGGSDPSNAPVFAWNLFLPTAEPDVDGGISGSSGSLRATSSPSPVANTQPEVPLDRPASTSAPSAGKDLAESSSTGSAAQPVPFADCNGAENRFETDVFVTFTGTGSITEAELDALKKGFQDSYYRARGLLNVATNACDRHSLSIDINKDDGFYGPIPGDNSGPFIIYRFAVSGTCRGCTKLFFPANANEYRPPSEAETSTAFDRYVQDNQIQLNGPFENVRRIIVVDEVDKVECSPKVTEFQTTVFVDIAGEVEKLTASELRQLKNTFANTYNSMGDTMCDQSFRRVGSIIVDYVPDLQSAVSIEQFYRLSFFVTGVCRDCPEDSFLFAASCFSSNTVATNLIPRATDIDGFQTAFGAEDVCYCTCFANDGAPCEKEFDERYAATIGTLYLPNLHYIDNVEEKSLRS